MSQRDGTVDDAKATSTGVGRVVFCSAYKCIDNAATSRKTGGRTSDLKLRIIENTQTNRIAGAGAGGDCVMLTWLPV